MLLSKCKYTLRGSTVYAFIYCELLLNIVLLSMLNVFIFHGCLSAVCALQSFEHLFLCKSAIFLSLCLLLCGQWLNHKRQSHREHLIETRCLLPQEKWWTRWFGLKEWAAIDTLNSRFYGSCLYKNVRRMICLYRKWKWQRCLHRFSISLMPSRHLPVWENAY